MYAMKLSISKGDNHEIIIEFSGGVVNHVIIRILLFAVL